MEGFPPRPPAGVSLGLAPPTEAPDTAEDLPGAVPLTLRVPRSTRRVLTGDIGTFLRSLGSAAGLGGSETLWPDSAAGAAVLEGRCGAGGAVSGGLSPLFPPQLRTFR